ncbi:Hint domain-containing protein [Loktanella sp. SALINAS62]|uniref:Hint domain-containing protein n=1 Tax=Loktanella sp. SALINAS62 TaxID=2706124 RepID=UPI001B8B882F|nr:Hint domain-containing protein [Loktanella sp. SALINAS62]MBS1300758.1 Hint domain-containing protein [Loktanella sp. SALINAS62]
MKTGFRGTFVIPWSQVELDGLMSPPVDHIRVGVCWSWTGDPVRVDGPSAVLPLGRSEEEASMRKRAAPTVRRLLDAANVPPLDSIPILQDPLFDKSLTVTDGFKTWDVTLVPRGAGRKPLVMFVDDIPPRRTELWIVRHSVDMQMRAETERVPRGVICFTPGTMIMTPFGPRDVASLAEGDVVQTQDNGPAEILWMGSRRVSGARIMALPDLAPVRLRAGALDRDVPDEGLLVSPDHRLVLRGVQARALFNCDEVLVAARDLVNDCSILRERGHRSVQYIHMLLPHHEIVFANGVATESFHPDNTPMGALDDDDRDRLFDRLPDMRVDTSLYGGTARRMLSVSETAVLKADGH